MTRHVAYLAEMEARGWRWHDDAGMFCALGAEDSRGCPVVGLRVCEWAPGEWVADYGVPGISYSTFRRHGTPTEAANDAEAWLRQVLAPLRLPWLTGDRLTPSTLTTEIPCHL